LPIPQIINYWQDAHRAYATTLVTQGAPEFFLPLEAKL